MRENAPLQPATGTSPPVAEVVHDQRGRPLRDLRISVTDRCNFRCPYCMPRAVFGSGYPYLKRAELLSFEEIIRIVRIFTGLGVRKIRLTGGEPLLRQDLHKLVAQLAELPGIELALTTNGALLGQQARALKAAGLDRVTVSLDALDDPTFRAMNDVDFPVAGVLEGIEAALAAGLAPLKINMVVKRGTNDHAVLPMARHFRNSGIMLRFIEYMDVGNANGWRLEDVVPSAELTALIGNEFPIEPVSPAYPGEVAERWRYRDGAGEIGFISSVTKAFCGDCNRLRLSIEGALFTCLFAHQGHDLRTLLRSGADDAALASDLRALWQAREDRYSELRGRTGIPLRKIEMSYIGG
ncbi:MAG TPA: GTP 3',8-cyclase MoaA [Rhodocyclaceae bacterium]|nr:GTP 3',8-cyclase MoaA [Rhodocyclaceae bacterium]